MAVQSLQLPCGIARGDRLGVTFIVDLTVGFNVNLLCCYIVDGRTHVAHDTMFCSGGGFCRSLLWLIVVGGSK